MPARNVTRGTVIANQVEVGASLLGKLLGLMGRRALPADHALWLPDSNGIHMMFMRFPIDAVFLGRPAGDGTRAVVSVHRSLRPWLGLVPFVRGGHGVLELPSGAIGGSGTAVGDRVLLD
jgi:uncharacterized membrane protein (UPF0127 family)